MSSRDWKELMNRKKEKEKKLTLDDIDVESDLNVFTYQASQIRITLEHTLPEGSYSVEDVFDPYIAVDELETAGDKLVKRIPLLKQAVKEAKAFEIIKSKGVDVALFTRLAKDGFGHAKYNCLIKDVYKNMDLVERHPLTEEEFASLKEALS